MKAGNILLSLAGIVLMCAIPACKPSEQHYREAYDRAVTARDSTPDGVPDSTIYTRIRREMKHGSMTVGADTVEVATQFVAITPDGGGINESLKRYCVVAAQFKQVFNARSMRQRLVDAGYPGAFVVQTREPYYFVVAGAYAEAAEAVEMIHHLETDRSISLKSPAPFILQPSQLARGK